MTTKTEVLKLISHINNLQDENNKLKIACKLALEALEANQPVNYCMNNNGEKFPMMQEDPFKFDRNSKAITAIKEALMSAPDGAQPALASEQSTTCGEPVAKYTGETYRCPMVILYKDIPIGTLLYTTPPPVPKAHKRPSRSDIKPLTGYINSAGINANDSPHIVVEKLERAIEAAHGIYAPPELKE